MPRYKTLVRRWISHESREVQAGEEFETEFPKVKTADGKEVEMKLGDTLQLVKADKPSKAAAA